MENLTSKLILLRRKVMKSYPIQKDKEVFERLVQENQDDKRFRTLLATLKMIQKPLRHAEQRRSS